MYSNPVNANMSNAGLKVMDLLLRALAVRESA